MSNIIANGCQSLLPMILNIVNFVTKILYASLSNTNEAGELKKDPAVKQRLN